MTAQVAITRVEVKRHVAGADVAAGHHQVADVPAVQAAERNVVGLRHA